jgi:hypothetical protein
MVTRRWCLVLATATFATVFSAAFAASPQQSTFASRTFAAAQTPKQRCITTCRARYRECHRLNQLPLSECGWIYQDYDSSLRCGHGWTCSTGQRQLD